VAARRRTTWVCRSAMRQGRLRDGGLFATGVFPMTGLQPCNMIALQAPDPSPTPNVTQASNATLA
jgi:hypothetical protein